MYLKWNLTKKCKLKCKFCHNVNERSHWPSDLDKEKIFQILDKIINASEVSGITLLGGEPTEVDFFEEICQKLEEANFKFGFITAGQTLHEERFKNILINHNLGFIGISIDSLNRKDVKSIRGVDVLEQQIKNLKYILDIKKEKNLNYKVCVNTILMNKNKDIIQQMINKFFEWRVDKVQILEYNPRNERETNLQLNFEEERLFLESLIPFYKENVESWKKTNFELDLCFLTPLAKEYINKKYGIELVGNNHSSVCPVYRDTAFITNYGGVYPCDSYKTYIELEDDGTPTKSFEVGNIYLDSLEKIFRGEFFKEIEEKKAIGKELYKNCYPCNECQHLCKECYPCMLLALEKNVNIEFAKCSFYLEKMKDE